MSTQGEFWPDTGPMSDDGTTCGPSHPPGIGESILCAEAIPVRPTVVPDEIGREERARRFLSSGLLKSFAHALFYEKTRWVQDALPGLGGDSDLLLSALATLSCPSAFEPVALGLTTSGTGCSCSPNWPTLTASDSVGSHPGTHTATVRSEVKRMFGSGPLNPEFGELLMGFPPEWTDCEPSATPSSPPSPNGSDGG
jgi:hypothetical protein